MNRRFVVVIFSFFNILLVAQEQVKKANLKLYGFVRNDFFYNSRLNKEGTDGLSVLYPLEIKNDAAGNDLNDVPQSEMLAYGTRLGVDISGLDILNSATTAKIESDFSGTSGMNPLFRIRHAYVNFNWGSTELLVGQTWHPLFSAMVPTVLNLNTGAPFQPFARSPQVNLSYKINKLKFNAAAVYQFQYSSTGIAGVSNNYIKYANMPEVFLGIETKNTAWVIGAGAEIKKIVPRTSTNLGGATLKVNESLLSYAGMVYAQYYNSLWCVKTKTTYGQNLTDLSMLGGYAVSRLDTISGQQNYSAFNVISAWINITYGKKWQVGLFTGFTQNLGTDKALYEKQALLSIYGSGVSGNQMIGAMYKVSPQLSYNLSHFRIGLEYDYTLAEWGDVTLRDGIVRNTKDVLNHRLLAFIAYYF